MTTTKHGTNQLSCVHRMSKLQKAQKELDAFRDRQPEIYDEIDAEHEEKKEEARCMRGRGFDEWCIVDETACVYRCWVESYEA